MSDSKKLDTLFNNIFTEGEPGGAVLIVKGDNIIYSNSFGLADMETKEPIAQNTFFNIASVSKQFTAVAILKLAEEGKLSLDDNVKSYFPEFKADFFKDITLRHLMSHSSGIPDNRPRIDRNFTLTCTDIDSYSSYMPDLDHLNFEPGTDYEYMNPTFDLLFTIIERVSGKSFDNYMRDEIFLPAGMQETTYFEADKFIPRMAHGYLPIEGYVRGDGAGKFKQYDYGEETFFATKADGGIYTSVEEFLKWEKALRNNILISRESREMAHSPKISTAKSKFSDYQQAPSISYGYGWFIDEKPNSPKRVFHTGDNGGFQIYASRFPEQDILVLIFANRNDWSRRNMAAQVEEIILGD